MASEQYRCPTTREYVGRPNICGGEGQARPREEMDTAVDSELSAVCVELREEQRCFMEVAHSSVTVTHLHPTLRCIVLREVLRVLDTFADGLPPATSLGDILSKVIGQSHRFLDFVHMQ